MIYLSRMTKFRKTRITEDILEDILEDMLKETICQAIQKGLIKSTAIIVDSTHTNAAVRPKTVTQVLRDLSKQLRKEIYREMYDLAENFPEKPGQTAELSEKIEYTCRLLENIGAEVLRSNNSKLIALYERIKELLGTDRIRKIRSKNDEDAHFWHKTAKSTFFGYKSHGGKADCKQLPPLLEKSQNNGVEIKEIIGDSV